MILELRIQNLILIEHADIVFGQGLNVLSGETGSGKSAIMEALQLICGERADAGVIRKGSSKGICEVIVQPPEVPGLFQILDDAGVEHTSKEPLILRREITSSGKSRALINDHAITISQLKQIASFLFEIAGQHANQLLLSTDQHRRILDDFAGLGDVTRQFQKDWNHENSVRKQLNTMVQNESARLREIERIEFEIEEISAAHLKDGEEEELFAEYTLLTNAEERSGKASEVLNGINGEKNGLLATMRKHKNLLEQLEHLDPNIAEAVKLHCNALLEMEEIGYLLNQYLSHIESNPEKLIPLDERLKLINALKRKYGGSILEVQKYFDGIKNRLKELECADHHIENLREELAKVESENDQKAAVLTAKRKEGLIKLEKEVQAELVTLNMPKAVFQVELSQQARSGSGDEKIEFYLVPNIGEHRIPIKDCASGGELSRILLALQTLLAGKASIPTLIFDEIDANVGGSTAVVVGEKLKQIGTRHQVLCITHFPQVAQYGDHHLQISKNEVDGRTLTQVKVLDKKARAKEIDRMSGKKAKG